jgi:hypothetical protein
MVTKLTPDSGMGSGGEQMGTPHTRSTLPLESTALLKQKAGLQTRTAMQELELTRYAVVMIPLKNWSLWKEQFIDLDTDQWKQRKKHRSCFSHMTEPWGDES